MTQDDSAQNVRDTMDFLIQLAVRDPKKDINPAKIFEVTDQLSEPERQQVMVELLSTMASIGTAFQHEVYRDVSNPLNLAAAGLAASCLGEIFSFIATKYPDLVDGPAAARRAVWAIGEARRISLTQTAGRIILPGEPG